MAPLEQLPPDQRAVLQLVLQRGRGYDEIAKLLAVDRAAVRERALAAFDGLGPQTRVPAERRALITDYLLGQLPPRVSEMVRDRLAQSASERAWARVIAAELAPLAGSPLPEIPVTAVRRAPEPAAAAPAAPASAAGDDEPAPAVRHEPAPDAEDLFRDEPAGGEAARDRQRAPAEPAAAPRAPARRRPQPPEAPERTERERGRGPALGGGRRSSRTGGALLLAGLGVVLIAAIVIAITSGGSSSHHSNTQQASTPPTATTPAGTSTTTTGTSTSPRVVSQINLSPPGGGKAAGIAEVLKQGANTGIAIVAQGVAPNTTHPADAYAVWLYNSPSDSLLLGFVNPGVGSNGRLSTAGGLPANAARFHSLIVTLETHSKPKTPGRIVLQGALSGV